MEALATESGRLLLTQGVLGLCVLVEAIVIVILFNRGATCQDARISDAKAIIEEQTRCITNSSQHIAVATLAINEMNRANEARVQALQALIASDDRLTEAVGRLEKDVDDMRRAR